MARKNHGSKWIRPEKRKRIYTRDDHTCVYCGHSIYEDANMVLTLDHVVAVELGGSNAHTNLVTACLSCNSSKQHKTVPQFIVFLSDQGIASKNIRKRVRNATRRVLPKIESKKTNCQVSNLAKNETGE